jgi:hypothetical protein
MEHYIHERSMPIIIKQANNNTINNSKELGLNHNIIDPFKMSPPNSFMNKLNSRMNTYYSPEIRKQVDNNSNSSYVNISTM